jgi:hypothetical protein
MVLSNYFLSVPLGGILRTSNGNCLPLRDLLMNLKSTAVLSYDWTDFQPDGVNKLRDSPLVLLGENGKKKSLGLFGPPQAFISMKSAY